jgi:predicted TPR repeat methyltransferase
MKKEGLFGKSATAFEQLLVKIPITYWGITKNMVGSNFKTVLDVGCGTGTQMQIIDPKHKSIATGVDIYEPYLKEVRKKKIYNNILKQDIRHLSFKDNSFDLVICFHVIEHLTKKEGIEVIKKMEKIAKKRIVLAMPVGHLHQEAFDGNEHQEHKSEWYPKDLEKMGYVVRGQGLKRLFKEENMVKKYGIFAYAIFLISMVFQPYLLFKPSKAVYMLAKKELH